MRATARRRPASALAGALVAASSILACIFAAPAQSAFPGGNGKIVFETGRDGNAEIYTMNADGSGQTRRTTSAGIDVEPAWSPDGAKVAFISNRDGNFEIYTMNANGTGQTRVTVQAAFDGGPIWSPDGTGMVFRTDRDGNSEIYTMNADGTGQVRRTTNAAQDGGAVWSPDGAKLAFYSDRDGNYEVYTMNADGTNPIRRTTNAAQDGAPDWSPDGTKIAFYSTRDGNHEIYTMNADGTGQTRLTNNPAVDIEPAWSPDGTQIAFHSNRDGNNEIYTMNADGTGQTRRTNISQEDAYPDWQPLSYQHPLRPLIARFPLVPAFRQTVSASQCSSRGGVPSQHDAPFAVTSCDPPTPVPGTTAYFGRRGFGMAQLNPTAGDPITTANEGDLGVTVSLTDIRVGTLEGADYFPDLTMVVRLRITDKRNCSPPGCGAPYYRPGTTADVDFSVPLNCSDTVDPAIGATCSTGTSANAVAPGAILEGRQTVNDTFRIKINDAGPDLIAGNADDKLFAQQGIYVR
jgi:Tol biopolymer transport system component